MWLASKRMANQKQSNQGGRVITIRDYGGTATLDPYQFTIGATGTTYFESPSFTVKVPEYFFEGVSFFSKKKMIKFKCMVMGIRTAHKLRLYKPKVVRKVFKVIFNIRVIFTYDKKTNKRKTWLKKLYKNNQTKGGE